MACLKNHKSPNHRPGTHQYNMPLPWLHQTSICQPDIRMGREKEYKRPITIFRVKFVSLENYTRGVVLFFTNRCRKYCCSCHVNTVITSCRTTITTITLPSDCWPRPPRDRIRTRDKGIIQLNSALT